MNIGTFTAQNTDLAFFGIMNNRGDTIVPDLQTHNDGVIAWGDNLYVPVVGGDGEGPDNLRFIFSAPYLQAGSSTAGRQFYCRQLWRT
jgi:hypothetical protein